MDNFKDIFTALITQENVTFALSIFGSIGTIVTLVHAFMTNRKSLHVAIVGHIFGDTKTLILYMAFTNKSRLPISITDVSIKINGICYPCTQPPIVAYEETEKINGIVTSHHEYITISMPINLSALGGSSGYVCFDFPPNIFPRNSTELTFLISSNRGKIIEKTLSLGRRFDL